MDEPKTEDFIPVTQSLIDELKNRQAISGMQPDEALLGRDNETPEGLDYRIVKGWMNGTLKQAKREHVEYILRIWVAPAPASNARVEIAPFLAEIEAQRKRTGRGSMTVLKGRKDIPDGLNSAIINSWLAGKTLTAKARHVDYVLRCYREMGDVEAGASIQERKADRQKRRAEEYCKVDKALVQLHFERTGVANDYFLNWPDAPKKLDRAAIQRLRDGAVGSMYRDVYVFILEKLVNAPDQAPEAAGLVVAKEGYVALSDEILAELRGYRDLGLLPSKIFKHTPFKHENPKPQMINAWINGQTRSARTEDLAFVLGLCEDVAGKK